MSRVRALGLVSGGLDSLLALLVMKDLGAEVAAVVFTSPFFGPKGAREVAKTAGVELFEKDITDEYLEMLQSPRYGFGKLMNPCIDCHGLMLQKAWELKEKEGFELVFTGEVLGQRPMSQRYDALGMVEKVAGLKGRVLRPLCAKLLKPTVYEEEGLVDRERLLDIQGRHRKRQLKLAQEFGVENVPSPAGGCLLTDQEFSARLRDLMEKGPRLTGERALLLSLGRHFRLPGGARLIVGRNHEENERIKELGEGEILVKTVNIPGPAGLVSPESSGEDLIFAMSIVAGYCKGDAGRVEMEARGPGAVYRGFAPRARKESVRPFMVRFKRDTDPAAEMVVTCPHCGKDSRMIPRRKDGAWELGCSLCGDAAGELHPRGGDARA